jgi:hypothetical protein
MKNITTRERVLLAAALVPALLALLTLPGRARAQEKRPKKSSTFLLVQAEGGFASSPYSQITGTFGCGLLLGVGGKFKGLPIRFYMIGAVNNTRYWHSGSFFQTAENYSMALNLLDVGGGLRILVPIVPRFRIYVDVLGIGSYHWSELQKGSMGELSSSAWTAGAIVAGGVEFRWHKNFATGLRVEGIFYREMAVGLSEMVGIEQRSSSRLFAGLTQAFLF